MQQEFTFCKLLLQNLHDIVVDPLLLFVTDFTLVVMSVCKMGGGLPFKMQPKQQQYMQACR
jgi:hypothetical protein